jgi:trans-aconitate 2-methyltransferase
MSWSAKQYTAFESERTRPVRDLLAAVPTTEVRRAVDIGCGPGNSTEVLIARWPGAQVTALDSSPDMLEAARERLPQIRIEQMDIERWDDEGPYDVILANAVLQWLPDHARLFPRLIQKLAPGGSLAVQMPDNIDESAHRLMREVASYGPWAKKLADKVSRRAPRQSPEWYYAALRRSCSALDVWRTTYHHALPGAAAVVEWFKGSGLRPFLSALDEDEKTQYLARYEAAIAQAYPALDDGLVLLPFPRLFVVATR